MPFAAAPPARIGFDKGRLGLQSQACGCFTTTGVLTSPPALRVAAPSI